jgi:hypothetical protein
MVYPTNLNLERRDGSVAPQMMRQNEMLTNAQMAIQQD